MQQKNYSNLVLKLLSTYQIHIFVWGNFPFKYKVNKNTMEQKPRVGTWLKLKHLTNIYGHCNYIKRFYRISVTLHKLSPLFCICIVMQSDTTWGSWTSSYLTFQTGIAPSVFSSYTVEPLYNEVLGTMKITLLYQVSCYIRGQKTKKYKELGPAKWPCYKRVLLYPTSL